MSERVSEVFWAMTYGGAMQYTETLRPTGSPLDVTVWHVFGSAHICHKVLISKKSDDM